MSRYGASDAVVVYPDEYVDFQNHSISIIEEMIQDDFFHISFTKEAFDSEVARSIPWISCYQKKNLLGSFHGQLTPFDDI